MANNEGNEEKHEELEFQKDITNTDEELKNIANDIESSNAEKNTDEKVAESALETEEKLKAEITGLQDKYLRLYSEFDNFKRRTHKERSELFKTAGQETMVALLPVLDDFERALNSIKTGKDTNIASISEGLLLVSSKFRGILNQRGLKEMEALGKDFDSDFHEAITKIPAPNEDMKGKVVDVVETGYFLYDKVIRYAKVIIGE